MSDVERDVAGGLGALYVRVYRRYGLRPREFAVIVAEALAEAVLEGERRAEAAGGGVDRRSGVSRLRPWTHNRTI